MILPPPPAEIRAPGPVARVLRAPFEARTWRETFHLLVNLPVGIATFTILVTGFATGLGMLITLLGIPIIVAMVYVSRWMASLERGRAKLLLDADVRPAWRSTAASSPSSAQAARPPPSCSFRTVPASNGPDGRNPMVSAPETAPTPRARSIRRGEKFQPYAG